SSKPVTSVQRVSSSENLRKTALQGGFFVSRARDYDATERISRRSFTIMEIYPTRAYRMHIVIKHWILCIPTKNKLEDKK
ncbi:hypothetical protein PU30_14920, partial [Escherichia coli]